MMWQILQRPGLLLHHVLIEIRRAPDSLACIVDDEVQSLPGLKQMTAESLDTWRVPQIETKNFETVAPGRKVRFCCVSRCGIPGEARCNNEMSSGTQ